MNTDTAYKFIGTPGSFVTADIPVPARDIAEWEVMQDAALRAVIEANIATSGAIYERVEPAVVAKKTAKQPVNVVTELTEDKAE